MPLQFFGAGELDIILLAADRESTLSSGQSSGLHPSFRLEASLLSTSLSDKETGISLKMACFVAVIVVMLTPFSHPLSRYHAFRILSGYRILGCAAISSRRPATSAQIRSYNLPSSSETISSQTLPVARIKVS